MRRNPAPQDQFARRGARRVVGDFAAVLALACFLVSGLARAETPAATEPPPAAAPPPPAVATTPLPASLPPPPPPNPALDVRTPAPEPSKPSVFRRWWFWTAVGAAAATTVVIIVVSSRGHAPPATDLGNQEFQP
jgi:hypothetical protein